MSDDTTPDTSLRDPRREIIPVDQINEAEWRAAYEPEDSRETVLNNAQRMLRMATLGLEDLTSGADLARRELGFYTVVVFGRSVTLALQNFRTNFKTEFDSWYEPKQVEMSADRSWCTSGTCATSS